MSKFFFKAKNGHIANCGTPPDFEAPDKDNALFFYENSHGEQFVLETPRRHGADAADYEKRLATLYFGDNGWDKPVSLQEVPFEEMKEKFAKTLAEKGEKNDLDAFFDHPGMTSMAGLCVFDSFPAKERRVVVLGGTTLCVVEARWLAACWQTVWHDAPKKS